MCRGYVVSIFCVRKLCTHFSTPVCSAWGTLVNTTSTLILIKSQECPNLTSQGQGQALCVLYGEYYWQRINYWYTCLAVSTLRQYTTQLIKILKKCQNWHCKHLVLYMNFEYLANRNLYLGCFYFSNKLSYTVTLLNFFLACVNFCYKHMQIKTKKTETANIDVFGCYAQPMSHNTLKTNLLSQTTPLGRTEYAQPWKLHLINVTRYII